MTQTHPAITRLLTTAYHKAKRHTRRRWRKHARPMTVKELCALPYEDYLQTEHWQKTRADALRRAGYQCQECRTKRHMLHVHHLTYKRLGREKPRDLQVLRETCHERAHDKPGALR